MRRYGTLVQNVKASTIAYDGRNKKYEWWCWGKSVHSKRCMMIGRHMIMGMQSLVCCVGRRSRLGLWSKLLYWQMFISLRHMQQHAFVHNSCRAQSSTASGCARNVWARRCACAGCCLDKLWGFTPGSQDRLRSMGERSEGTCWGRWLKWFGNGIL
jgi:hypothetical protein